MYKGRKESEELILMQMKPNEVWRTIHGNCYEFADLLEKIDGDLNTDTMDMVYEFYEAISHIQDLTRQLISEIERSQNNEL